MIELPRFFGLDFSTASTWVIVGFVVGVLLTALWALVARGRAKAKAEAQIATIQSLLESSRAEHQADVTRLLSDTRNYETALADAERRANQSGEQLANTRQEIERLTQLEIKGRNDLLASDNEMSKLRGELQWAQTQASGARTTASELTTAKTALEIKESEIARLINELQWHQSNSTTLEKEKAYFDAEAAKFNKVKSTEIARLQDELGGARGIIYRIEGELEDQSKSFMTAQSSYDQVWKDHAYMRNLAYWQTSEIGRLRTLVSRQEDEVVAKSKALSAAELQYANLKSRLATPGKGLGGAKNRLAYFRRQGTNGTSADAHAHAKGNGKLAFAHKRRDGETKMRGTNGYKPGKSAAGRAANRLKPNTGARLIPTQNSAGLSELADLRARLAELSQDAEKYHRLRDAVQVANKIADEAV